MPHALCMQLLRCPAHPSGAHMPTRQLHRSRAMPCTAVRPLPANLSCSLHTHVHRHHMVERAVSTSGSGGGTPAGVNAPAQAPDGESDEGRWELHLLPESGPMTMA